MLKLSKKILFTLSRNVSHKEQFKRAAKQEAGGSRGGKSRQRKTVLCVLSIVWYKERERESESEYRNCGNYLPPAEWTSSESWATMKMAEASVIHMTAASLFALFALLALLWCGRC